MDSAPTAPDPARQPKPLRALLVEDDPDDAELVVRELRRGGHDPVWERVQTAAAMAEALKQSWDVVLSDYSMPTFTAPEAYALMRKLNLDLPFIVVSGTVGEDTAVEVMRAGMHDFLLKGHLRRLVAAIEREIGEAAVRAERRKIREQLLISERMASVGTLAAGVAHEINNPLSVVVGNLQVIAQDAKLLAESLDALPAAARAEMGDRLARYRSAATSLLEATADAEEAGERVRTIVRDLRVFSRSEGDERTAVDVHAVLESSLRMARNEIRHRAKIVRRLGDVPRVDANEARLGQVFLNLIVNAAHAIPEGKAEANAITVATRRLADMIAVEISDTGSGIPPEVLPRIFDIFFTTKPIGVGTGLGLAICHRIVSALNGRIEVDSTPGTGTTFRVLLRRARSGRTAEVPRHNTVEPSPQRERTVLAIEDEAAIGRTVQRLLAPHRVTVVTRAREALDRISAGEHFDAILCDLMMPEMTGMDFHAELRRLQPALADRIVFMSGGAFTASGRDFLDRIPNPRIDKPIDAMKLRLLVEAAAGATGPHE
jgi:signal transduction histidine kinase